MGNGDVGGGKKPAGPPKAAAPKLPPGIDPGLKGFVDCTANEAELKPGKLKIDGWNLDVSYAAGETPASVDISVGIGAGLGITLPASVAGGKLSIDTSKFNAVKGLLPKKFDPKQIDDFVKKFNDWLDANGKKLGPPRVKDGTVKIAKEAAAPAGAAVAPTPKEKPVEAAPELVIDDAGAGVPVETQKLVTGEKTEYDYVDTKVEQPGLPAGEVFKPKEPPPDPEKTKTGLKTFGAGVGALATGFAVGFVAANLFGGEGDQAAAVAPSDPVPIVAAAEPPPPPPPPPAPEPETQTVMRFPEGLVPGEMQVTGPRSFGTPVFFEQTNGTFVMNVPGTPAFSGVFNDDGTFRVENDVGSFTGRFDGSAFNAAHVFQGENFNAQGTIDQPVVEETTQVGGTPPPPPAQPPPQLPFVGGIGEGLAFETVGTTGGGGDGGGGGGLLLFGGLTLLGLGSGLLFAGGLGSKQATAEEGGPIGGILEGFAGIGAPPAPETRTGIGWDGAHKLWERHQDELVKVFADALWEFKDSWANAMTHLDAYRETFNRLVSGSTSMQGLMREWEEELEIRQKQDLAFAIATLVVSGVGIAKSGYKLVSAWKSGGAVAEVLGKMPPAEAAILKSLAKESGKDIGQLLTKHGGDVGAVSQELFYAVFNKRGWHYLGKTKVFLDAVVKDVDVAETVSQVITGARTGLKGAKGGTAATLAENVQILKEIAAKDPKFIESLKTAVVDVAIQGEKGGFLSMHAAAGTEALIADLSFARAAGNAAEVARLEALIAKAQASQVATATVKLLDDVDFQLLQKVLDSGGDITQLTEALGPAGIEGLSAGAAKTAPWVGQFTGTGLLAVGTTTLAISALGEKQLDVSQFSDQFGLTAGLPAGSVKGYFGLLGSVLWGFISAPFVTWGRVNKTLDALSMSREFLAEHGDDLLKLSGELQQASHSLGQAAQQIRNSRLPQELEEGARALDGDLLDLQRALGGMTREEREDKKRELEEIRREVAQKITAIGDTIDQLKAAQQAAASLAETLGNLAKTKGVGVLDPNVLMRVEAARTLLLSMMNTMLQTPLPGQSASPGWGFGPQIDAELKFWKASHPGPK
jgi:hypothetical protein